MIIRRKLRINTNFSIDHWQNTVELLSKMMHLSNDKLNFYSSTLKTQRDTFTGQGETTALNTEILTRAQFSRFLVRAVLFSFEKLKTTNENKKTPKTQLNF